MTAPGAGRLADIFGPTGIAIDTSDAATAAASRDFGGIARGRVAGVVRPETIDQLTEIVKLARRHHCTIAPRGMGLSQSGQSIAQGGVTVDCRALQRIEAPNLERSTVICEPGATWRRVVERVAPLGLAPKVMPLNLDLTLGGTLSAGGLGSSSHRHGLCASNVASLEVVLGSGEVVRCSPTAERGVFDSVLGGLGRIGLIRSVELSLARTPANVRTFYLLYDKLSTWLADQQKIADRGRAAHLEGFCSASVQGLRKGPNGRREALRRWSYGLHISVGWDDEAPTADEVLAGLDPSELLLVEDDGIVPFSARYDARFEAMRVTGGWEQLHPWVESFVPLEAAPGVIELAMELPAFLGDGHRVIPIAEVDRPAAVAFPNRGPSVAVAILPTGVPDALREPALAALKAFHDRIRAVGGKRYLSGWLFDMDRARAWEEHYGPAYQRLSVLEREYDPDGLFRSCLPRL
jgi:cytokinin dehydrogenase